MTQVIKNPNCIDDWIVAIARKIESAQQHVVVNDTVDHDFVVLALSEAMGLLFTMNEKFKGTLRKDGATMNEEEKISPYNFMETIRANVDNDKLSDANFRQFIRDSLPIVRKDG